MRKIRLPVHLNEITWRITDSASIRKIPPMRAAHLRLGEDRKRGERPAEPHGAGVAHERLGRVGVEPEETDGGADQAGAEDGEVEILGVAPWAAPEAIQATTLMAVNVKTEIATVPAARPSRPSVRFTPFAAPAIIRKRSTYQPCRKLDVDADQRQVDVGLIVELRRQSRRTR